MTGPTTRLSTARSNLTKAGGAVAIAAAGFFGGQLTAVQPYIASPEELHQVIGRKLGAEEMQFARMNLVGEFEAVAVEIPSERWSSQDLKDYLRRLDYFQFRVEDLLKARLEFEAALADSLEAAK